MAKAHRLQRFKITTFLPIERGSWSFRFSVTDLDTIMVFCHHVKDESKCFIKYFNDEEAALAFVDFLECQPTYQVDAPDPAYLHRRPER